jgi:hypothetical protein
VCSSRPDAVDVLHLRTRLLWGVLGCRVDACDVESACIRATVVAIRVGLWGGFDCVLTVGLALDCLLDCASLLLSVWCQNGSVLSAYVCVLVCACVHMRVYSEFVMPYEASMACCYLVCCRQLLCSNTVCCLLESAA